MEDTGRQRKNFVGYEYKEIIAESSRISFLLDGYECFGWELDEKRTENRGNQNLPYPKKEVFHLKWNRKIINKMELTRLQRNYEACLKEIETLEKSKTSIATIYALVVVQYAEDIEHRCADTENRRREDTQEKAGKYKDILSVLEFSMLFCGRITNCFEDYFAGEKDYAEHLSNYVAFASKGIDADVALKAFCVHTIKKGSPIRNIGLYYDELHPIINKNIVYTQMYGNEKLFRNCYTKVSEKDIQVYYKDRSSLEEFFKNGKCRDAEEETLLRKFQKEKDHIELTEITTYSEIVNDFMGQLISWAYLRERDLMYFQLGYHYMRLFYSDCVEADSFLRVLKGENINIQENAVLYQIIAMYTYELPVLTRDKSGKAKKQKDNLAVGGNVVDFYKGYCKDKGKIYQSGLCLFENVESGHDEIVNFRKYIDHFKYYSHMDRSILDLYSDVYDRFFTYDTKLRKSVSFIFRNILQRYFVIAETEMHSGNSKKYPKEGEKETIKEKVAKLSIKSLESDKFEFSKGIPKPKKKPQAHGQYQNKNGQKKQEQEAEDLRIDARDKNFLEQLQRILEYSEA